MTTETNKALVRHWVEEVINSGHLDVLDQTHGAEHINHFLPFNAPRGPEGEKMLTQQFLSAFPGARFEIDEMIAEGDKVAMRYTYHGAHTGVFNGMPATGKSFSVGGQNILRVENGKIVENWVQFDTMSLMQQLGAIPSPA
jgi:steroid delta-isomerase-like uncharacterized protein